MGAVEKAAAREAWRGDSFAGAADYSLDLTQRDRAEILAALAALRAGGRLSPAQALLRPDFPFDALGERLGGARDEVRAGRGFVLLRGLPLDGLVLDDFIAAVWGVGAWFGEEGPGEEPVTPYRIPVFALRGVTLTEQELAAMELFDEVARAPEHRLAFRLERGDMLIVNNYTVMHARTKFVEHAEPQRRRHLVGCGSMRRVSATCRAK